MCGLCGSLGGDADWTHGVTGPDAAAVPWRRRQARRARIRLANRVLRASGLTLEEWQGSAMLLRNRTGATAIVGGLLDLWPAAERLGRRAIDPLDPALVAALDG